MGFELPTSALQAHYTITVLSSHIYIEYYIHLYMCSFIILAYICAALCSRAAYEVSSFTHDLVLFIKWCQLKIGVGILLYKLEFYQ